MAVEHSSHIKRKQQWLYLLGIVLVMGVFAFFLWEPPKKEKNTQPKSIHVDMQTATDTLSNHALWVHQTEQQTKLLKEEIESLKAKLQKNEDEQASLIKEKETQEAKMQQMSEHLDDIQKTIAKSIQASENEFSESLSFDALEKTSSTSIQHPIKHMQKVTLALQSNETAKTPANTLPAGSVVSAVLLGGVDAPTALKSVNDPKPVVLELTNDGSLPRRFQSDVNQCRLIGAATGDLSSERVYIRLETLSCIERQSGNITETQVAGFVAGEDGRVGIKGPVVMRDTSYIQKSFLGGALSGASKSLSALSQPQTLFNAFTGHTNRKGGDMLMQGAGDGMGHALDRYAQYHIERAELMQPVIQIAAGREVDVVFTKGVTFGDMHTQSSISRLRENAKRQEVMMNKESCIHGNC